jgi:hypothetical protein
MMIRCNVVARTVEQVGDQIMDGEEALKLECRLEAFHDLLSSSYQLMRILRPVIQVLVRAMFDTRHYLASGCPVRTKLIGDHYAW